MATDGFAASQPVFQPFELFLPVGMMAYGGIGRIHHGAAQVASSGFGDMPVGMHLAAVMDAGSEPGVAHQVAGIFEALDRSDGGQEGDRCQHGDPWQLGQQRDAFILCSFLAQDFFNCIDLLPGEGQGIQVGCDDVLFDGREW